MPTERVCNVPHRKAVNICVGIFDAGCLPVVLKRAMAEAQLHLRVNGGNMSEEAQNNAKIYLAQLRACLVAVEKVLT